MSDSVNHPPLEELAAYIDGMLPEAEAARVAEHIAECEDCFFVYSETVRFQLEHPDEAAEPKQEEGDVVPFPTEAVKPKRRKPPLRWVAAAAAAVLAIALGILLYRSLGLRSMPELTTAELVVPVQAVPGIEDKLFSYKVTRGGEGEESEWQQQSFMIGFLFTDLRLALEAGEAKGASERLRKIGVILLNIGGMEEIGNSLIQDSARIESAADCQSVLADMDQWEWEMGQWEKEASEAEETASWVVDPDYVTFGKWAEAARLAALLQKPEFFERRENRRVLSYVLGSEEMSPSDEVVADLREIETIWDKDDLQSQDFAALAGKFKAILQAYDFTA